MRKLKAFLIALVLFVFTVLTAHGIVHSHAGRNNPAFSLWNSEEKAKNPAALDENWNDGSFPVFGSSEFQHGTDTPFHPASLFADNRFNPMLIGAGYYQSLSHAIALSAIDSGLTLRKAVLIVSPQWFRKPGVLPQAYASRFSETMYCRMLENERLDEETRAYMIGRTHALLEQVDTKTEKRLTVHEKVISGEMTDPLAGFSDRIWSGFLEEKDSFQIRTAEWAEGIGTAAGIPEEDEEPDWTQYRLLAEQTGDTGYQNPLYIMQEAYDRLEPYLPEKKGMNSDALKGYQYSPEYDDLSCFLQVCRQLDITPMVVLMPVNGYYYDFTEFPASARQAYYEKVRGVAEEGGAVVADFTDQEYTKYFFEDRVHLGAVGWVMVNERLYRFYKEGM